MSKHAKKIFLASKPPPTIESRFANREDFQLGSLSHFINCRAVDYQDLPAFPAQPPDPTVRTVEVSTARLGGRFSWDQLRILSLNYNVKFARAVSFIEQVGYKGMS